ncbi:MAG: hypothetical protein WEB60_13460 [Terrimicrobiaceae bacterium]
MFPCFAAAILFILLTMTSSPASTQPIPCPQIPGVDTSDWEAIQQGFRKAPALAFRQAWNEKTERGFCKGTVRIGWQKDRFLCFAELEDRDVITRASERNQELWTLGDVLELFTGVHGQPSYIEYHTAPNGLTLQLRFPDSETLKNLGQPGGLKAVMVKDDAALVQTRKTRTGWEIYGEVPAASVWAKKPPKASLAGQVWDLHFGRYDYSSDKKAPVLSSTAPLTRAAYHRRHEWQRIKFVE